jgi:type VI secretion system protein VasJ
MSADDVLAEVRTKLEPLLAPINGGVGDDISYDEAFEAVKNEIDKQNSFDGGTIDWSTIQSNSESLLEDRSKDFRVALYWAAARAQSKTTRGVLEGIVLLLDLSKAFWSDMYPALKRPRARGNLCAWYAELTGPVIQGLSPQPAERGAVDGLDKAFNELDGLLAEGLGEAYPGMMQIRDAVRGLVHRAPAEAPPPPPPPPPPPARAEPAPVSAQAQSSEVSYAAYEAPAPHDTGVPAAAGIGWSADDIVDGDTAYRALSELVPLIHRAGDVMLGMNPASVDGFRLNRAASWLLIAGAPYNEGGQTQIEGPREHVVSGLAEMAAGGDWMGLMNAALQVGAEFPLWLDHVRYLATALENLGGDFEIAAKVIVAELGALLARAPELVDLSFVDGTPFANEETRAWAASASAKPAGGGAASRSSGGGGRSPVDKAVADADAAAAEGDVAKAIQVLARAVTQAQAPAHRFRARLELGKLCLRNSLFDIARAQLEGLERLAEDHRLAAWDPELCVEMYANLYRVRKAQSAQSYDDLELQKRVAQSFERLCELDAAQAYAVMQEQ